MVCYADNILVVTNGANWGRATMNANLAVACVVGTIKELGLRVAPEKIEAVFLYNGSNEDPPQVRTYIRIDKVQIQVENSLKYLRLTLDGWGFIGHFITA